MVWYMRAVDTNVLIRFVMKDDPLQTGAARRFLEECRTTREHVFITVPVVCELVWVLDRVFGQTKAEIVGALERFLDLALFQFDQEGAIRRGLAQYRRGRADLADYLIGELSAQAECRDTVTFDRALRGAPGFTIL
jgi:predicted nucleic-acid-binding protein